jgi:hypothetical protein
MTATVPFLLGNILFLRHNSKNIKHEISTT